METKRFSSWGDLGVLAAVFFGSILVAGLVMAIVLFASGGAEPSGPILFTSYTVQFVLAVIGGIIWLHYRGGVKLRFGVRWSAGPTILWGVVLITATSLVLEPLLNLFPEHYLEKLDGLIGSGGWAIAMTVVAAPILEEIFFRGLLLERLSRRWSATAAVMASAALFGAAHVPILPQMVNAFVIAVFMGYLYLVTRSLVPVIIIHAINNGLAYITLQLTGTQNTDTRELVGNDTVYWIVYAASAVVMVVSLVVLVKKTNNKTPKTALQEEDE